MKQAYKSAEVCEGRHICRACVWRGGGLLLIRHWSNRFKLL